MVSSGLNLFSRLLMTVLLAGSGGVLPLASGVAQPAGDSADWPQWGGRNRNFMTDSTGLAAAWPASGPRKLWTRALGEGYSAISVAGDRLYTMYRARPGMLQFGKQDQEVVIAMEAATGKTLWEHSYDAPILPRMNVEYGPGPHATPLVVGSRVFTVGATGKFFALDKTNGKVLWSHDLNREYGVLWGRGYSCSPIAYRNTVILVTGRPGRSIMAFQQDTGAVAWEKLDLDYGPGSPILITVRAAGTRNPQRQEQLVVFMANEIAGVNPSNGELLWSYPHKTDWGLNISTPVWIPDGNLLFCSSAYSTGSRMLQLALAGGKTTVKQLWFSTRMRLHIGNAIRLGEYVYGSSGDFGPAFLSAIHTQTGQIAWQDRGFSRASLVYADGKLIVLDEDGNLGLASVTPQGLKVHSRAEVLTNRSWTAPTLVSKTLYLRDRKTIVALDLG